jgi:hypothetical protein
MDTPTAIAPTKPFRHADQRPVPSDSREQLWREDMIAALFATTLILGLFLDGWNHINLQNGALGSFFTPWHGLLYAGFTATATWVMTRNRHLYLRGRAPKPEFHVLFGLRLRYPFAVAGLALATVGVLGDAVWHGVLGVEGGVARVIAPFHLLLFAGGGLVIAAPLRSAWHAPRHYPSDASFRELLPPLLSLTLLTALAAFMFQWLSAFMDWAPSIQLGSLPSAALARSPLGGTAEVAGVAGIIVTNVVLMAPVLLAVRRWRLPFGSVTFLFTVTAFLMSSLTNFASAGAILAAAIGGRTADGLIAGFRPSPARPLAVRAIACGVPLVMWSSYFVIQRVTAGVAWPLDLYLGTVGLSGLTGGLLSFLAVPPAIPSVD